MLSYRILRIWTRSPGDRIPARREFVLKWNYIGWVCFCLCYLRRKSPNENLFSTFIIGERYNVWKEKVAQDSKRDLENAIFWSSCLCLSKVKTNLRPLGKNWRNMMLMGFLKTIFVQQAGENIDNMTILV